MVEPLLVDGKTVTCDAYVADYGKNVDYRPVRVQTSRTMRARPLVAAGWKTTHQFELLTDVIEPRNLEPVIERAGRLCGLGDWRPIYGAFTTEIDFDLEVRDAA